MKESDLKEEQIQGAIKATGRVSPHRKRQLYDNGITVKEYLEQCWGGKV